MSNPFQGTPVIDKKTGEEFNPKNAQVKSRSSGKTMTASKLFNDSGELNAGSKAEALDKICAILDGVNDGSYQIAKQANYGENLGMSESDAILREAFSDPNSEGFRQLGQALLNPIKEVIDYEGLARKIFAPRTVKAGEVIRYDRDVYVMAWVIAEDGQTPESVAQGQYFYPPEFEVTANPSIELKDKYRAQFDILARIADRARQGIEYREDVALVNLLNAGGNTTNVTSFYATLNIAALEAMRYQVERNRLVCDKFLIHRREVSDLVNNLTPAQVDPVTRRELLMAGYIGTVLNAQIVTTAGTSPLTYEVLTPGQAIAVTSPEYLGGMPIRVELFSEPYNQFVLGLPRQGWFWYELISQVLINTAGVAIGSKTT